MIQASQDYITALNAMSRTFRARLLLNGEEVPCDIKSITCYKGAGGVIAPGSLFIPSIQGVLYGNQESLKGKSVEYVLGIVSGDSILEITVGSFYVVTAKKTTDTTEITAVNELAIKGTYVYEANISYPATINAALSDIISQTGTTAAERMSMQLKGFSGTGVINSLDGHTIIDCLSIIAGVLGGFVTVDNGKTVVIAGYGSGETLSVNGDRSANQPVFEETAYEVTGVKVIVEEGGTDEDGTAIAGTSYEYGVPNVTYENQYMTQVLFNQMRTGLVGYTCSSGDAGLTLGDPRLEPWDSLSVTDLNGDVHILPCLEITHIYDGGLMTEVRADLKTDEEESAVLKGPYAKALETVSAKLFTANQAILKRVKASEIEAEKAYIDALIAGDVTAANLIADHGTIGTLDSSYARINFANVETEAVKNLFVNVGLIENATIQEGRITGTLAGVHIVADVIEANTIVSGNLLVRAQEGEDTYYKINLSDSGISLAEAEALVYEKFIHGDHIVAKSITAEKVSVSDLVAFGATIGGFQIDDDSINSVGKTSAGDNVEGIYLGSGQTATLGVGSSSGNHIIYNGEDIDIKTDWMEFDSDQNALILNGYRTAKVSGNYTLTNYWGYAELSFALASAIEESITFTVSDSQGGTVSTVTLAAGETDCVVYPRQYFFGEYKVTADLGDSSQYVFSNGETSAVSSFLSWSIDPAALVILKKQAEIVPVVTIADGATVFGNPMSGEKYMVIGNDRIAVYDQEGNAAVLTGDTETGSWNLDKNYVYTQSTAASTWNIAHGLSKYPAVTVVDSAGSEVEGDCEYVDENNVVLTFSGAFSGKAFFN